MSVSDQESGRLFWSPVPRDFLGASFVRELAARDLRVIALGRDAGRDSSPLRGAWE